MALLNFPNNPSAQSPTNTFSPTSTPEASTNGITYIYQSGKWFGTGQSGGGGDPGLPISGGNLTGNLTLGTDKIVLDASDGSASFAGSASVSGKVISASTDAGDPGTTLTTKDYVDANSGGGGGGVTSLSAGSGISLSGSTGDITITNTGGGGGGGGSDRYIYSDDYASASDFNTALQEGRVGLISKSTAGGDGPSLVIRNDYVQPSLVPASLYSQAKFNTLQVWSGTQNVSPIDPNLSRIGIQASMGAYGSQHGDAIRANLYNQSDDGQGNTAFYGYAASYTGSNWSAAVHGETRHKGSTSIGISSENAGFTDSGTMIGVSSHMTTGNAATHPEGGSPASPTNTYAFKTTGSGQTSSVGDAGRWGTGLLIDDNSIRETDGVGVNIKGKMAIGLNLIDCDPASNAVAIAADDTIALEASSAIEFGYDSSASAIKFYNGSSTNLTIKNGGDLTARGKFICTGLTSQAAITALGTITGNSLASENNIFATGSISGSGISSTGGITATGTVSCNKLDSSGDVEGNTFKADGKLEFGSYTLEKVSGQYLEINADGTKYQFYSANALVIDGQIRASSDNTRPCGGGSYRWTSVFATNGTINTSDKTLKTDIRDLSAAEKATAKEVKSMIRAFRWKDNPEKVHFGVIAQDTAAVFEKNGLDPMDYAMFDVTELEEGGIRWGVSYSEMLSFIISQI